MARLEGLYAITPDWPDDARLAHTTEAILRGGCRIVQYRNKSATPARRAHQAIALRALTRRFDALLIINDDIHLALEVGADGVHLGEGDGDLLQARMLLGGDRLVGASCYQSLAAAAAARDADVDYIAFGSFFPSPTKPQAGRAEPGLITEARKAFGLPVAAIGGVTRDNASGLVAAGADMLAVISAVYNADDPEQASRAFRQLYEEHRPS